MSWLVSWRDGQYSFANSLQSSWVLPFLLLCTDATRQDYKEQCKRTEGTSPTDAMLTFVDTLFQLDESLSEAAYNPMLLLDFFLTSKCRLKTLREEHGEHTKDKLVEWTRDTELANVEPPQSIS